jgi:hypothetical protein
MSRRRYIFSLLLILVVLPLITPAHAIGLALSETYLHWSYTAALSSYRDGGGQATSGASAASGMLTSFSVAGTSPLSNYIANSGQSNAGKSSVYWIHDSGMLPISKDFSNPYRGPLTSIYADVSTRSAARAVPEPSSALFLVIGLAGLAVWRSRRPNTFTA